MEAAIESVVRRVLAEELAGFRSQLVRELKATLESHLRLYRSGGVAPGAVSDVPVLQELSAPPDSGTAPSGLAVVPTDAAADEDPDTCKACAVCSFALPGTLPARLFLRPQFPLRFA